MLAISQSTAIGIELITAFLWGSWFQTVKKTCGYPLASFMIWLYVFSNALVWGVMWIFRGVFVPEGIENALSARPQLIWVMLTGGALFGISMQLSMIIMSQIGIILSVSVTSTLQIFTGTFIPMLLSGLPNHITSWHLVCCAVIFLSATMLCQFSGVVRDKDKSKTNHQTAPKKKTGRKICYLFALNTVLGFGYPVSMSLGMRSVTNPDGLPPLLACGLLCLGALIGTLVFSGIRLARSRQLNTVFRPGARVIGLSMWAACGHFGGNITHMIAAPVLSLAVAWPLTTTSNVWSYFWGIAIGEYKGCSRRAAALLAGGMLTFLIGVVFVSQVIYAP